MRLKLISLDSGFSEDRVVSDPSPVAKATGKFSDRGVFSESIFGRLPSSGREYSCACGDLDGHFYDGLRCPKCNTVATCRDTVFSKRGWVDFAPHRVISPLFYGYLSRVVGATPLRKILCQERVLTADGVARGDGAPGPNFEGLGMLAFAERWPEVVDHFARRRASDPRVAEAARVCRENPGLVMTTCLPVYSHILRPALMIEKQLRFDEVNNVFNLLVANAQVLAEYSGAERTDANVNAVLWRIQEHANEILDHVMKVLSGKGGYLRSSLLGLRVNFSARAVIIPLPPGHEQDEVHIPYLAFLELYRFQLTNLLARTRGIGIREANELWHRAQTRPDRTVLAAMREMISRAGGLFCLLNRNPTINFGSILRMRITGVLVDPGNLCFRLPNMVLRSISGDFDGDVVSLLPLLDEDTSNAFACFDPRLMYTSRDQLGLNRTMRLDKDHVLGLSVLTEDPPILHDFSN